jgi:hypothetical protein
MFSLEDLKTWFEEVFFIIVDLKISVNNAKRITEVIYEYESVLKRHGFFQHHFYQLKFIMVIQLAKLLSNSQNQKRNLFKLCNCLDNLKYDEHLKKHLIENKKKEIHFL